MSDRAEPSRRAVELVPDFFGHLRVPPHDLSKLDELMTQA